MRARKLYNLASPEFRLPLYVDRGGSLKTVSSGRIPFIKWPDGSWCTLANCYMIELNDRGLSRRDGGTLLTYATHISHLIRFCFFEEINLIDLTDDQFSEFIAGLCATEVGGTKRSGPMRNTNSVLAIGRCCLEFLSNVGKNLGDESFVGRAGRIRCDIRETRHGRRPGGPGGRWSTKLRLHHRSFPTPGPRAKRLPIDSDTISRLRAAVCSTTSSSFVRKRRFLMIKLLEITGGRRSEVASLTVASVRQAAAMDQPMLRLPTHKKRHGASEDRMVPIHKADIRSLTEFIDINRSTVIRRTNRLGCDHGVLLISAKTGDMLKASTITKEVSLLRDAAQITEKVCPHMFRHRFITRLFVSLIEAHRCENQDDFRRALLDVQTLKQKIREWTGHVSLDSLDTYIHLAVDEIDDFKKTYDAAFVRLAVDSFQASIEQAIAEFSCASVRTDSKRIAERLEATLSDFRRDLDA